jgi:hypothetical protein
MEQVRETTSLSIIESVSMTQVSDTLKKINQFQQLIHSQLNQNQDFGIIPGTKKPTLLKPGAEKILMLMGITSEFPIVDSTRDFEKGFFQYQVCCRLTKNGMLLTEGLGAANTKEKKYAFDYINPFDVDNTVLKMAKKRALVDATLLVASLSDVFTQDLEDVDLTGEQLPTEHPTHQHIAPDSVDLISAAQAKRMYAMSQGNPELCKQAAMKHGYSEGHKSAEIKKVDYEAICKDIESAVANGGNLQI